MKTQKEGSLLSIGADLCSKLNMSKLINSWLNSKRTPLDGKIVQSLSKTTIVIQLKISKINISTNTSLRIGNCQAAAHSLEWSLSKNSTIVETWSKPRNIDKVGTEKQLAYLQIEMIPFTMEWQNKMQFGGSQCETLQKHSYRQVGKWIRASNNRMKEVSMLFTRQNFRLISLYMLVKNS